MRVVLGIVIGIITFIVIPIMIECCLIEREDEGSIIAGYMEGLAITCFSIIVIGFFCAKCNLSLTGMIYCVIFYEAIILVPLLIFQIYDFFSGLRKLCNLYRKNMVSNTVILVCILLIAIITILFIPMDIQSGNYAVTMFSWNNNSLFDANPYTGNEEVISNMKMINYMYLIIYAASGKICAVNPMMCVTIFYRFGIIVLALLMGFLFAEYFYSGNTKKRSMFMVVYILLYIAGFSGEISVSQMLFVDSCRGNTIYLNIILPYVIYKFIVATENGFYLKRRNRFFRFVFTVSLFTIWGQTLYKYSLKYTVLLAIACAIVGLLGGFRSVRYNNSNQECE